MGMARWPPHVLLVDAAGAGGWSGRGGEVELLFERIDEALTRRRRRGRCGCLAEVFRDFVAVEGGRGLYPAGSEIAKGAALCWTGLATSRGGGVVVADGAVTRGAAKGVVRELRGRRVQG